MGLVANGLFDHGDPPTIADLLRGTRRQENRARTQQDRLGGRSIVDIMTENQIRRTGQADVGAAQRFASEVGPESQIADAELSQAELGGPAQVEVFQELLRGLGGGLVDEVAERTRLNPERARNVAEMRDFMERTGIEQYFQIGEENLAQLLFGDR